jgi:phosphoglycolate phosphatase-like HAD superfamily hydrolase
MHASAHLKHDAILIDVDGTLIDSNGAHARAWARAFAEYGFDISVERLRRTIGMGGDKILPAVDSALSNETEPGKSISALHQKLFLEEYLPHLAPTPGGRDLLVALGKAGLQRVVATSAKRDELDKLLDAAGVADQIDMAVTSDDAERSKPDTDVLHSALRKARVSVERAAYLGDTPYDVEACRRAGLCCVAVTCGGWSPQELGGADAIYADPADVLEHLAESPI